MNKGGIWVPNVESRSLVGKDLGAGIHGSSVIGPCVWDSRSPHNAEVSRLFASRCSRFFNTLEHEQGPRIGANSGSLGICSTDLQQGRLKAGREGPISRISMLAPVRRKIFRTTCPASHPEKAPFRAFAQNDRADSRISLWVGRLAEVLYANSLPCCLLLRGR